MDENVTEAVRENVRVKRKVIFFSLMKPFSKGESYHRKK